jgi:uncharacterized protein YndB with AHSA1/START domain
VKACFTIHRTIDAPAERVFDALTDHRGYAKMTPMRVSTIEKEGEPAPNGVGAVRKLGLAGPPIVEEVIGYERPTFFSYKVLSGLPVKEQVGEVRLRDVGGRTELSYTVSYTAKIPRTEPVVGVVTRQAIGALVRGIAKSVE